MQPRPQTWNSDLDHREIVSRTPTDLKKIVRAYEHSSSLHPGHHSESYFPLEESCATVCSSAFSPVQVADFEVFRATIGQQNGLLMC